MDKILEYKLTTLKDELKKMGKVAIAYSGGVDSNFLLKVAKDTLGDNVLAITINAMMHSTREIKEANYYAKEFGVKHIVYKVDDFNLPEFIDNGPLRCYYCKKIVFDKIKEIASEHNIKYILDGTNLSDLDDYRPGLKVLEELNIIKRTYSLLSHASYKSPDSDLLLQTASSPSLSKPPEIPSASNHCPALHRQ